MRIPRLVVLVVAPVAVLALAGCTSFADGAEPTATSAPSVSTGTPDGSATASAPPAEDLAVVDELDLATPAAQVTGARLVADGDGYAVLLTGSSPTVTTPTSATAITGGVPTDVVLVDGDPVAASLGADPVATDPVLGLVPIAGTSAGPRPLAPQQTAPRGIPVLAAAPGDAVLLLAEDPDDLVARVLSVDPGTGRVQGSADLDPGVDGATSLDLVGLVAGADGEVVAGLDLLTPDGSSASRLVTLDDDLEPVGDAVEVDGRLLALVAGDGDVRPLVADPDGGVELAGRSVGGDELGTRVTGAATSGGTAVTAFLDQDSPTVTVTGDDAPRTVALCDGDGDALAVAATDDGGFLVAGTCDGTARLWTLG